MFFCIISAFIDQEYVNPNNSNLNLDFILSDDYHLLLTAATPPC